jgi:dienelactone hydrolase
VVVGGCTVPTPGSQPIPTIPSDHQVTPFAGTYKALGLPGPSCNTSGTFIGAEPTAGTHPVFVFVHATSGVPDAADGRAFVEVAARRGFVAISVAYDSQNFINDPGVNGNADCIFNSSHANGAVGQACARARADCSKGIVAVGHSQGGAIVMRSANYEPRVRAVSPMGYSIATGSFHDDPPDGSRAIPDNAVWVINGVRDIDVGALAGLKRRTGMDCGPMTVQDCRRADGSGYYIIQNDQVADGNADHCWFQGYCSTVPPLDPEWTTANPSDPSHLRTQIEWLDSRADE